MVAAARTVCLSALECTESVRLTAPKTSAVEKRAAANKARVEKFFLVFIFELGIGMRREVAVCQKSFCGLTSGKFLDAQVKKIGAQPRGWTPTSAWIGYLLMG